MGIVRSARLSAMSRSTFEACSSPAGPPYRIHSATVTANAAAVRTTVRRTSVRGDSGARGCGNSTDTGRTSGVSSRAPAHSASRNSTTAAWPSTSRDSVSRSWKSSVGNGLSSPAASISGRHSSCSAR